MPYKLSPGEIRVRNDGGEGYFSAGTPVASLGTISISSELKEGVAGNLICRSGPLWMD